MGAAITPTGAAAGGVTSAPADRAVSITMLYMSCNLLNRNGRRWRCPS